jgi:hypothetical protein
MMRKVLLGIAAVATLGGAALVATAPAQAQGFSITIGDGFDRGYHRPAGPGYGYGPPPGFYGGPPRHNPYYAPAYGGGYGYHQRRPRCWVRPVTVWNGYGYVTRPQRVCR